MAHALYFDAPPVCLLNADGEQQGLAHPHVGTTGILNIIKKLGFVQLDSIRNVTRAHHLIYRVAPTAPGFLTGG